MTRRWLVCSLLVALLAGTPTLLAPLARADDAPKKSIDDYGIEKAAPGTEMPTFSGKGKVNQAINGDIGAIFDIGGGVTMTFPKGLPVGRSRLVTLQKGRGSLPAKLVGPKWRGIGPVLDFSGTFTTSRQPILLAIPSKKDPTTKGMKLVVAMEVGTFCEGDHKAHKLGGGLCSGFELHDAEHDPAGGRLVAKLRSTGGHRMQFGLVAEE
jgi:hypothetical protein